MTAEPLPTSTNQCWRGFSATGFSFPRDSAKGLYVGYGDHTQRAIC
jgi:hypothetical protein